jgi:hypothetical protein
MFDFSSLMNFLPDFMQQQTQNAAGDKPLFLSPEAMSGATPQAANPTNPLAGLFSGNNAESLRKQLILQALMGNKQQSMNAPVAPVPPPMPIGGGMPNRFNQPSQPPMGMPGMMPPRRFLGQG